MLDRKTSFEQTQEYVEPYSQSNSRADRGLLNASQPQSLSTLLTASHDEPRKKGARPTSMQAYVQPITSARRIQRPNSNQSSGGLNKSTYVRNTSAFSVVESALANGRSVFGGDKKNQQSVESLAKLVSSEIDFETAFTQSVAIDTKSNGSNKKNNLLTQSQRSTGDSRVDHLLEGSKKFCIGSREFVFDENEAIFFMMTPKRSQDYHNTTEGCNTCAAPWTKLSDLQNSHCTFCGISNCKNCIKKQRSFRVDRRRSMMGQVGVAVAERGKICKVCDRKFFIKSMVHESSMMIKAQNLTIENALRQTRERKNDIADTVMKNREYFDNEKHKIALLEAEIVREEEAINKLQQEAEDLTQETNFNSQKQQMFKQQLEDITQYNQDLNNRLRQTVVTQKMNEEKLRQEINESVRIQEELKRLSRRGRQPSLSGETKEQRKKREDRVSGKSFESDQSENVHVSDRDSTIVGNMMVIPEDDLDLGKMPHFGAENQMMTSQDTELGQSKTGYDSKKEAQQKLSVIFSEGESNVHITTESEVDETLEGGGETLANGKSSSKRRMKKKKVINKKGANDKQAQAACCGGGCALF